MFRKPGNPRSYQTTSENWRQSQGGANCDNWRLRPSGSNEDLSSKSFSRHFARTERTASINVDPQRRSRFGFSSTNRRGAISRNDNYRTRTHHTDYVATPPPSRGRFNRSLHGFETIKDLSEKDPDELLLELSGDKISELVQSGLDEDSIVCFTKFLKKVSDDDTKCQILQKYLDDNFVEQLTKYILSLPVQNEEHKKRNTHFWKDPEEFWNNIVSICQNVQDFLPTFARKVLPLIVKSTSSCFQNFEHHVPDHVKKRVNDLLELVDTWTKYEEIQKAKEKKTFEEQEPPDDFRCISVYPTSRELLDASPVFLRKNVVDGPYQDVHHYLDVQFRLLREDFVGPLRTGISAYCSEHKPPERQRLENVKIHSKVQFLNSETVNEQFCFRLRFDFSNQKKSYNYENSKKFMFGSLLLFTVDNFKSIFCGKVAQRDVRDLHKGELVAGFDHNVTVKFNVDYQMVECGVYFEPYYHVLNVLQTMSVYSFPMEKYIIHVDPSVDPPEYLVSSSCRYTVQGHKFSPLDEWPRTRFYDLNESQLAAFRAAITQEFAIIQGPPGTGKTFLGLKIAKTLLKNQDLWYRRTPMLVICYTNHALDQFLEGILEYTDNIVRVGGQSKSEALELFNLKSLMVYGRIPAVREVREIVKTILNHIKHATEDLKRIDLYQRVENFSVFRDVVPNFRRTWFGTAKESDILDWLTTEVKNSTFSKSWDIGIAEMNDHDNASKEDKQEGLDKEVETDENVENQVDDLFDLMKLKEIYKDNCLVSLNSINKKMYDLEGVLFQLETIECPTLEQLIAKDNCYYELLRLQRLDDYLQVRLRQGRANSSTQREMPNNVDLIQPHNIAPDDRWNLYFYWLDLYKNHLREKLNRLNDHFHKVYAKYESLRNIANAKLMKSCLVVGITTTGAARLHSTLQALRSPIVIVEEAAEVLEAHIVASLTRHCQHLILIGDHQQLKPSTANYNVEKFYKLGISLFERMVINKIQLHTLEVQHRMRPEISSLISPTIYPALKDHPSVSNRPLIGGLDKCLFFIDHTHKEVKCEGASKVNHHEAEFLVLLARHLVLNGYDPENVTILAAYSGQMFQMQKEKDRHRDVLNNVKVTILDNYQGEECDIILLSLVRSNDENKIGFLSIENRVCVALSRARNGLYIMGNMSQLCAASELWQKICYSLQQQQAIGPELKLRCQVHPEKVTYVKTGKDFLQVPEGGCSQKCNEELICGHKCTSFCHILDRDHEVYKCREVCNKRLCEVDESHLCKKMCYQECGPCNYPIPRSLACGHTVDLECHVDVNTYECVVLVSTELPCGHVVDKPCHRDPETYKCPQPCEAKVEPCGHACRLTCHVREDPDHLQYQCTKKCARYRKNCTLELEKHLCPKLCYEACESCTILIRKKRSVCPHVYDVPCSSNVDDLVCEKPCKKILPCGHKCKSKCHEPCGKCEMQVTKTHPECGHPIKTKCCEEPDRKFCNKKCPLKLLCGHSCTKKCNEPCTNPCEALVDCELPSSCGHTVTTVKCWVANSNGDGDPATLLQHCQHPCTTTLKCGHVCTGTCAECLQGRVHKRCTGKHGSLQAALVDLAAVENFYGSWLENTKERKELKLKVESLREKSHIVDCPELKDFLKMVKSRLRAIQNGQRQQISKPALYAIRTKLQLLDSMLDVCSSKGGLPTTQVTLLVSVLSRDEDSITEQEIEDIQNELNRLREMVEYRKVEKSLSNGQVESLVGQIDKLLLSTVKSCDEDEESVKQEISETGRREVVEATGLEQGHWFRCDNGHVYAIGKRGCSMEKSCPECKVKIEGRNHALVDGNGLESEMVVVNSAANMEDYELDF